MPYFHHTAMSLTTAFSIPLPLGSFQTSLSSRASLDKHAAVSHFICSSTSPQPLSVLSMTAPSPMSPLSRRQFLICFASTALGTFMNQSAYGQTAPVPEQALEESASSAATTAPKSTISPPKKSVTPPGFSLQNTPFISTPKVIATDENGLQRTDTGIAFIDFTEGDGRTPEWGDIITLHYTLYTINPKNNQLVKHDSSYVGDKKGYLLHHGNGEHILGLEQMLHTMSTGSYRRFILPPRLAYYQPGFAPIPRSNIGRKRLSRDLSNSSGLVVMDVEVLRIQKDLTDHGYYSALNLTEEEEGQLFDSIPKKKPPPGVPAFYL